MAHLIVTFSIIFGFCLALNTFFTMLRIKLGKRGHESWLDLFCFGLIATIISLVAVVVLNNVLPETLIKENEIQLQPIVFLSLIFGSAIAGNWLGFVIGKFCPERSRRVKSKEVKV